MKDDIICGEKALFDHKNGHFHMWTVNIKKCFRPISPKHLSCFYAYFDKTKFAGKDRFCCRWRHIFHDLILRSKRTTISQVSPLGCRHCKNRKKQIRRKNVRHFKLCEHLFWIGNIIYYIDNLLHIPNVFNIKCSISLSVKSLFVRISITSMSQI